MTARTSGERERKLVEENLGACNCIPGFKDRNLTDPSCAWCNHGEDLVEDILAYGDTIRREALEEAIKISSNSDDRDEIRALLDKLDDGAGE